jgi:chromosome segregation protein
MEARRQGVSGAIREILEARENKDDDRYGYVEGIVADIISADAEHAMIVEAALEGRTDALVVKSTGAFLADGEVAEKLKSRVKVICMDKVRPFADKADLSEHPQVKGRVVEFVRCQGRHMQLAWDLLGRTILVDSMDGAMELAGQIGGGYRFVTVKGEVFDGEKVISVGPVGQAEGLISRKSRLHQIEMELEEISNAVCRIEAQMSENNRQNVHLERLCKNLRTAIYEANTEKVNTESAIRVLSQDIKRISEEQPVITSEIDMLAEEISQSVQKEYESKQKLEELEAVNEERTAHIRQLEAEIATKRKIQDGRAAELTEVKVLLGQISEQQKSIRQQAGSLQSQLQHGRTAIESARMEMLGCDEQILQSQRTILKSESQINELFVQKEEAQKVSVEMHEKVQKMLAEKDETEVRLKAGRTQQADIEQRMHEAQLVLSQLAVRDEDLTARVREELQIDIVDAYKDFEQGEVDWEAIRAEIADLRSKIERLGNVNVDAIKEQDELEQRFDFLTGQVDDLDKSKNQLEQLIAKINKESQEKFRVTFDEVRENFQVIFRKLFGGGKADIYLEDAEDILECGIEIVARPPGKETRTISLLSGGEKTMTAIALLFAVFKSKPSPFCVLDEVDAALDEANNERFNLIVQEFKADSQFIVITHSKRTMSIADVLFGVTMQTQGVSKKISVQFDSADTETDVAVA